MGAAPAREHNPALPVALAAVVARALEKDPAGGTRARPTWATTCPGSGPGSIVADRGDDRTRHDLHRVEALDRADYRDDPSSPPAGAPGSP